MLRALASLTGRRTVRLVAAGGVLLAAAFAAGPAGAQTPSFGFYRQQARCSYILDTLAIARYLRNPTQDSDEWSDADPGTIASSASAGGATASAQVGVTTSADGAASISVAGTHTDGLSDADTASDANLKSDDRTQTVCELQTTGLPSGTTFTLSVQLRLFINDSLNSYTESGGWTFKDGDYDGPGGCRVQLNGGMVIITYHNGTQQYQYPGG